MSYEILTQRDGNWQIEAVATEKSEAESIGRQTLNRPDVTGVKVVRETGRSIAQIKASDVIFEHIKTPGGDSDRIFVNEIDEAPDCESLADIMGPGGRMTVNRLFRSYLDKNNITATEVMHSHKELKRAMDADTLVPSAIAKVAQLQAKDGDASSNDRRDILFDFVKQIMERAHKAEAKKLPQIKVEGFNASFKKLGDIADGDEFDYLLRVTIAKELLDNRNWWGKLIQTVEWVDATKDPRALNALDGFLSDTLANNSVLQDLLGQQEDLGSALSAMIDLASGDLDIGEPEDFPEESVEKTAAQLNKLLGTGKMPASQAMLMDRIRQQLQGKGSLSTGQEDGERERFKDILDKLVTREEILGGPNMAQAVTERQSRILNKGGIAGLREATGRVIPSLGEPARKASFLLSLNDSKIGQGDLAEEIQDHLNSLFMRPDSIHRIVKDDLPPNRKMEQVTSTIYRIKNSGLPESRKEQLTGRLDDLLASYIEDGQILQKIDNPDRPLHIRAFMLVNMCQPEILPKGKASDLARKIIIDSLKQPNFETELVSQIDSDEEKGRVLRDFHEQLNRCGFFE
ncbi:MAG: hypothetical protein OSB69_00910 [Alphaproteobacteria bacterium]|nr:hypothetical protein [Alphaproteobacteria bacterium]